MNKKYVDYKIRAYKNLKKELLESDREIANVQFHKNIHSFLCLLLKIKSAILGQKIHIINDKSVETNKSVIYAVTHIGKYDFEMVMEGLKKFFYVLAGDWELMYGNIDDMFFRANGVFYVDTEDKEDRKNSYKLNVKALKQGIPLLWFPEGIWNLSENLPMLDIYPGIINAAKEADVQIIPIAIDQKGTKFYINIGENIDVKTLKDDPQRQLRDILATLKWEIWEQFDLEKRQSIPDDYYEKFLEKRFDEWPQFNMDIIKKREYKKGGVKVK